MGLTISLTKWIKYVNLLQNICHRSQYLTIMDDFLVLGLGKYHMDPLESLFQVLVKHGLKLSPNKCELFRKN